MRCAIFQTNCRLGKHSLKIVTIAGSSGAVDHFFRVPFTSLHDESIVNRVKINAEAVLTVAGTEVEQFPQAVPVDERVNCVEAVSCPHGLESPENHLKGILGHLRAVLVDELWARVWWNA